MEKIQQMVAEHLYHMILESHQTRRSAWNLLMGLICTLEFGWSAIMLQTSVFLNIQKRPLAQKFTHHLNDSTHKKPIKTRQNLTKKVSLGVKKRANIWKHFLSMFAGTAFAKTGECAFTKGDAQFNGGIRG